MNKLLLSLSFMCLLILIIGTSLFPESPLFWLATDGTPYQYAREALAFVLLLQLFTRPPRNVAFRMVSGVLAVVVSGWTLGATYSNHMLVLDSLSFLAASIAVGVTALELRAPYDSEAENYQAS